MAAAAVVVLSHQGWENLFAFDPAVIGRPLLVNGHPDPVAGVMPDGFRGCARRRRTIGRRWRSSISSAPG